VQATGPPELLALAADIEHVRARMDDTVNETLRRRLVQAQEEERRALAAHIHDDPVQVLTALSMRLQALRRDLDDPDQAAELAELDRLVRDTMSRLRELLFELHPPTLDDEGLVAAIDLYLRERAPRDLVWRVDSDLPTPGGSTLPGPVRTLAYRLAREAIWNAVVHSGASLLEVFIALRDGGLELRVRDDGRGFDLARAEDERPGHLGLANVRELAEGFGGQLHIDSHPDVGTSIDIWLPVPEV
jgi:signal transduction histidine kinase